MDKIFTFKSKKEFIKFTLAMLTAYILNFITLKICLGISVNPYISQIFAGEIIL